MLLKNKNAVVYGAGGSIGGAVAKAFAREGARVFLVGRTLADLERLANEIAAAGGMAETAQVDALDEQALDKYVDAVVERAGSIDVSFNAIQIADSVQGTPLVDLSPEAVSQPVMHRVRTNFLTARAAARHMTSSFGIEGAAIEGLCRSLASELSPQACGSSAYGRPVRLNRSLTTSAISPGRRVSALRR
jgi:3-oxoacyl-[acyl-carrier protein] reductase